YLAGKYGWKRKTKQFIPRLIQAPVDYSSLNTLTAGPLATDTIDELKKTFADLKHIPSEDMWAAILQLLVVLEAVANGQADAKFYLSSLDPGVGKTQAVVHFVRRLLLSESYQATGVLLLVSRLEELERLFEQIGVSKDKIAIISGDTDINQLGT